MSFFDRLRAGIVAFKEAYLVSGVIDSHDWSEQDARRLRYQVLWSQYDGSAYRNAYAWAEAYRKQYGLYRYIRPLYNPTFRIGEFYKTHIFGGQLDINAGDDGAIPISTDNERLRAAIATLWKWSRWQVQKDILTTRGAVLGDAAIVVVDDTARGRTYLDLLHPGMLQEVTKDPFGNVKGYVISDLREDPDKASRTAAYTEIASRDGDWVVYETLRNGAPYAWPENTNRTGEPVSTWREPYGFVPMVVVQHNDVGLEWGWSELHPVRAKVQEVDGIASQLGDQIRKTIDPIWLMKGMKRTTVEMSYTHTDSDRPEPGREELQALWNVPTDGGAEAMVPELDIENVLAHIGSLLEEIERDVLELSSDIHTASGDASGRALRTARQPVTAKVTGRRGNYDAAMVSAQQMAVAIGGFRGYDGYSGFSLDSYARGELDHSISERSVFSEDPLDDIEIGAAFWAAAKAAIDAGASLTGYLQDAGWDEERIARVTTGTTTLMGG
jgi:hypothetical protein